MGLVEQDIRRKVRPGKPLAVSLERWRLQLYLLMGLVDIALITVAFMFAAKAYLGSFTHDSMSDAGSLFTLLYLTIAAYNGTLSLKAMASFVYAAKRLVLAAAQAVALVLLVLFYSKTSSEFSRVAFSLGIGASLVAMISARLLASRMIAARWGPNPCNILIIEDGGPAIEMANAYHLSAEEHDLSPRSDDPEFLNRVGQYVKNMDRVIVSCPLERRDEWTPVLRAAGVRGELTSGILHELGAIALNKEGRFTTLVISTGPMGLRARAIKRMMDVAIAGLALLILSPVLAVVCIAIRLDDGGPVLFKQRRVGRGNVFFNVLKFRSMRADGADQTGTCSASRSDPRVTRIGHFLRRTSLDELPQLLNVLRGEMSLIGPRPHALGSQAGNKLFWEIDPRYWYRHSLKPGLTGLAQVNGLRGATDREADLTERVRYDLEYIQNWSPWLDLTILARTLKVLVHQNAY